MSFPVTLLVFGVILLVVGLVGQVKAKEIEIGANSRIVRFILGSVGGLFIALSLLLSDVPNIVFGDSSDDTTPPTEDQIERDQSQLDEANPQETRPGQEQTEEEPPQAAEDSTSEYVRLTGIRVDPNYPTNMPGGWVGLPPSWNRGIDAAIFLDTNERAYFFKDNQYVRLTGTRVDAGYPQALPGGWRGLPASWNSGIDAAIFLESNQKAYFFKGDEYVRLTGTTVDAGYPQPLPGGWRGLPTSWNSGIDAAIFVDSNEKAYFFKGNEYVRLTGVTVDPGYPQALPGGWQNLPWTSGIDAAILLESNNKGYFFRDGP